MSSLLDMVETLMEDCGFSDDLYIIKDNGDEVYIEVDDKAATEYILKIANEEQYSGAMAGQYIRNGKRHRITFFLW
jgi:hypothetical protein